MEDKVTLAWRFTTVTRCCRLPSRDDSGAAASPLGDTSLRDARFAIFRIPAYTTAVDSRMLSSRKRVGRHEKAPL
jgi:hypothetical protein